MGSFWCCVELFVYVQMVDGENAHQAPVVQTIGADAAQQTLVREGWRTFDSGDCDCFNIEDKKRILAVIAQHPGGWPHCGTMEP